MPFLLGVICNGQLQGLSVQVELLMYMVEYMKQALLLVLEQEQESLLNLATARLIRIQILGPHGPQLAIKDSMEMMMSIKVPLVV